MKKIVSIIIVMLMLSLTAVHAEQTGRLLPLLVDDADILTESEENVILNLLESVSADVDCDVAVVTVQSLDGKSAQAYADDFYDFYGYGMGAGDDGILFLVAMDEREWAFSTYGDAHSAIGDGALDELEDAITPYLSSGDYYNAFVTYADHAQLFIDYYNTNGAPMYDDSTLSLGGKIVVSAVVAAILAFIVMLTMKSGMKTIRHNNYATPYVVSGSLNVKRSRDMFLYRNVIRTRRESSSSSSGGGTHRSSSGRSHGGRSGRF